MKNANRQQGVVTIEFALGFFAFVFVFFVVMELCRFIFITNMTETALSESSRLIRTYEAERYETGYEARLKEVFERQDALWNFMVDPDQFDFTYEQFSNLENAASGQVTSNCERCPVVVYRLTYDYQPLLFSSELASSRIERSLLTIQEHEGWGSEG